MRISRVLLLILLALYSIQRWLDSKINSSDIEHLNSFNFLKTYKIIKTSESPKYIWLKFIIQIFLVLTFITAIGIAMIKIYDSSLLDGFDYDF